MILTLWLDAPLERIFSFFPLLSPIPRELIQHSNFLKTPQEETLDLCILLRLAGTQFIVTGDVVQGSSGEVLSELGPIVSSEQEEESEIFGQHICRYILDQEDTLIQALR